MRDRNREGRARVARNTLIILEEGSYINRSGLRVELRDVLNQAVKNSKLYRPAEFDNIEKNITDLINQKVCSNPRIEVTDETTLEAAERLVVGEGVKDTVCLNFASAKNPGGGFLGGSQAQEESLARTSGLYPCISQMTEMYNYNRGLKTCLYSDYMIYSPKVPVIKNDKNSLLDKPYLVSFITAPAVNAGVVRGRETENIDRMHSVMVERIVKILSVAALNGEKSIVLGAYGCGVFKNKPEDVAEYFRTVLFDRGYKNIFESITFAIYDSSEDKGKVNIFARALLSGQ